MEGYIMGGRENVASIPATGPYAAQKWPDRNELKRRRYNELVVALLCEESTANDDRRTRVGRALAQILHAFPVGAVVLNALTDQHVIDKIIDMFNDPLAFSLGTTRLPLEHTLRSMGHRNDEVIVLLTTRTSRDEPIQTQRQKGMAKILFDARIGVAVFPYLIDSTAIKRIEEAWKVA